MKVLAVETSSKVASVAVANQTTLLCEYTLNNQNTHCQTVVPMIQSALNNLSITADDIDIFACSAGPGSFTGLRIGAATIKGLAHATGKPVCAISTLEAMAFNLCFFNGLVVPIMDARRQQVYTAVYKNMNTICQPTAIPLQQLIEQLKDLTVDTVGAVMFCGDGVDVYKDTIMEKMGQQALFPPVCLKLQRAASVAELALEKAKNNQLVSYNDFVPFYIRKPQAERELEN